MEVQRKRTKVKKKKAKPLDGNNSWCLRSASANVHYTGTGYVNVEIAKDNLEDKVVKVNL